MPDHDNHSFFTVRLALAFGLLVFAIMPFSGHAQQAELDQTLTTDDARHLFSRTGFGFSLAQHDQVSGMTRREAVDTVMQGFDTKPSLAMPAWVSGDVPYHWSTRGMDRAERVRFERDRDQELAQLRQWWVSEMLQSPSPQTERLVLFWHDIMATSYHGVDHQSMAMARQNAMFRQYGLSKFGHLLKALIRDPAMLNYLDNENSKKQSPNENLARELLERFSMGEGNYTEHTVREAARALTGYSVSHDHNLSFRFETWKHDKGSKTLFGQSGKFDGDDLIDVILTQAATSEFVVGKFWQLLVSDAAPSQDDIAPLAAQLRASDYDLAQLYETLLMSDAFWHLDNRIAQVKSPVTLQVALARSLEYPKVHWQKMSLASASLGMSLFAPPNVSGWNEGTAFTTAGRLKQRDGVVESLLALNQPDQVQTDQSAQMTGGMASEMAAGMGMMMAPGFSVSMAAEDYRGPAHYRLELYNDDNLLWQSAELHWMDGHDTVQFGKVGDMSNMPWKQTTVTPPPELIERADSVRVHFLNDKAGPDGDRNLYVHGVTIADNYFSASTGTQQSGCVPRNSANAGNLYCKGYVDIPTKLNTALPAASRSNEPFQVGNARVRWGKIGKNKQTSRLALTLEAVQAPHQQWRNISLALHSKNAQQVEIRIDSYSCWPECFTTAEECVWLDKIDGVTHTWVFPLVSESSDEHLCDYQSLSSQEQQLVDAIWMALPELMAHAAVAEGDGRYAKVLAHWQKRISKLGDNLNKSRYAQASNPFVVTPGLLNKARPPAIVQAPEVLIKTHEQLQNQLTLRDLDVFDLIMPGVGVEQFPQLAATRGQTLSQQLGAYSQHAISQLY